MQEIKFTETISNLWGIDIHTRDIPFFLYFHRYTLVQFVSFRIVDFIFKILLSAFLTMRNSCFKKSHWQITVLTGLWEDYLAHISWLSSLPTWSSQDGLRSSELWMLARHRYCLKKSFRQSFVYVRHSVQSNVFSRVADFDTQIFLLSTCYLPQHADIHVINSYLLRAQALVLLCHDRLLELHFWIFVEVKNLTKYLNRFQNSRVFVISWTNQC